ncbi:MULTISPECIES: oligosaccharide flippase family protein [unclassified Sphingopyxis]|nr:MULTISPECIES: oligosaccharide flippase family protein [unclassified Sphingopyxis]KTE57828.1 polysaccharide biosynthesis protein [Sphingopyxis sp. H071]KTE72558.1 polysaccharide biosynthesis protein [Sphingopyxis sp. H081]KTE28329.1 polysaccharide biosynthesis protein [Sphingopyxis sp. H057]KTE55866.1 polysaccharide biosynthesis protein [Sphingopyxis sp. H073]KTE61180.1 polysaccharide biosynthesis protein [Sphingopyxis sp. H107]
MSEEAVQPAVTNRHVARGLGTTVLARLGAVVEIVTQPLYVLMFGLAGFGLYAVLWAAINLIENIFDLGMTSAMQRTVPQSASDAEAAAALRTALLFGVGPCLVVSALIAIFAADLAPWLNVAEKDRALVTPAIQIFVWALPLWAFVEIATSALRARMVFGAEIRLRIVWEQVMRVVFAVLFFALGFGLEGLFIAHLCSLAVTAILSVRLLRRYYSFGDLFRGGRGSEVERNTFWAGLSVLPSNIITRLFGDAPALILNLMLPGASGAAAAGLFTIARKLSSVVQLVRIAFAYVVAPLAASAERGGREQVADIYAYATRLISAIALPMAAVLAAGSSSLLSLFGAQAHVAQGAVIILFIARAIEAVVGISLPVLQVVAAFRHQLTASLLGVLVAVGAGWLFVDHVDALTGVTLAMSIGLVVMAGIPMLQLAIGEGLHPFDHQFPMVALRGLAITIVAGALALLVSRLPDPVALPLIIAIAVGAIWLSVRFGLPYADRASLGKTGRRLRLIGPDARVAEAGDPA